MKKSYIFRLVLLSLVILLPLFKLNTEVGAVSEIDNKYLTDFPDIDLGFSKFSNQLNDYLTERLGGRGRLIQLNASLNDRLFGYLDHPSYEYGQEGYVYRNLKRLEKDYDFLDSFTDLLQDIQDYCTKRDVPFVYVLNPAKWTVYPQYLPKGYNIENERLSYLLKSLEDKNINHIDLAHTLIEHSKNEQVFNKVYDAGHWNALGAFYGVNGLLEKMSEFDGSIQANDLEDFLVDELLQTQHRYTNISIHEYVPLIKPREDQWQWVEMEIKDEIIQSSQHRSFIRTRSQADNDTKLLMFQGSGFNNKYLGHEFIAYAISDYTAIHNYENLIEFDYYFNLFRPNFVVVNSAEYATIASYFSPERMQEKKFNPPLDRELFTHKDYKITPPVIDKYTHVTTLWFEDLDISYGYLADDSLSYDLIDSKDKWYLSAFNSELDLSKSRLYLVLENGEHISLDITSD